MSAWARALSHRDVFKAIRIQSAPSGRFYFARMCLLSSALKHDPHSRAEDDILLPRIESDCENLPASDGDELAQMARDLKMDKVKLAQKIVRHHVKESEGSLGSGIEGMNLSNNPCANWSASEGFACNNGGIISCPSCNLVKYCSLECKEENLKHHKCHCTPASNSEGLRPAAVRPQANRPKLETVTKFLWGNVPAYGILGQHVMSADLPQNLQLCFAASGDIRNVIETVCQLPDDFSGQANIYINDHNPIVVARNFLMLKLLQLYDYEAIDAVIALWYSVGMTRSQSIVIDGVVLDTLNNTVCQGKEGVFQVDFKSFSGSTLSVEDGSELWILLARMSASRCSMCSALSSRMEMLNLGRSKFNQKLACLHPSHQVAWKVFREQGLLLPFGAYHAHHNAPNKFLLDPSADWLMNGDANPLNGWNTMNMLATASMQGVPFSDLFGSLFFHIRQKLKTFVRKLQRCKVHLKLSCKDASHLAYHLLDQNIKLHSVDTSNIADVNYGGIKQVLDDWGPLLDSTSVFKSTLITYFMNWAFFDPISTLEHATLSKLTWSDIDAVVAIMAKRSPLESKRLMELLKIGNSSGNISILNYFHDFNASFTGYLNALHAEAAAGRVGLKRREKHLIVPHRFGIGLVDSNGIPGSYCSVDQCYYDCMVSDLTFTEQIVEWRIEE